MTVTITTAGYRLVLDVYSDEDGYWFGIKSVTADGYFPAIEDLATWLAANKRDIERQAYEQLLRDIKHDEQDYAA